MSIEEEDWKSVHLAWIHKTKTFLPKFYYDYSVPYLEIMSQIYQNPVATQAYAHMCYNEDRAWHDKVNALINHKEESNEYFVTIGFSHETWTIPKCLSLIDRIFKFEWICYGEAVFELHRAGGIHPHVHMIIKVRDSKIKKGKIIEKIWGRPNHPHLYISRLVPNRASVSVSPCLEYHKTNYINGIKAEAKMQFVELDRKWREDNNIPHKIFTDP